MEMFPLLGPHDGSFARANDWQEWTRRESYECARGVRVQTTVYWEQLESRDEANSRANSPLFFFFGSIYGMRNGNIKGFTS